MNLIKRLYISHAGNSMTTLPLAVLWPVVTVACCRHNRLCQFCGHTMTHCLREQSFAAHPLRIRMLPFEWYQSMAQARGAIIRIVSWVHFTASGASNVSLSWAMCPHTQQGGRCVSPTCVQGVHWRHCPGPGSNKSKISRNLR